MDTNPVPRSPIWLAVILALVCLRAMAAPSQTLSYQGYLVDGKGPLNGTVSISFSLYDVSTRGTPLWTQTITAVAVNQGLFSVQLGGTGAPPFPDGLFDNTLWIGLNVNGDGEMVPRRPLDGVSYAFRAGDAYTLGGMQAAEVIAAAAAGSGLVITQLPFTIAAPGAYYLDGNLSVDGAGILVDADDVSIDLRGFSLSGSGTTPGHGIDLNGRRNISIRNGTVRGFGLSGVYQGLTSGDYASVVDLRVIDNGTGGNGPDHSGIYLAGSFNRVERCIVGGNGGYGIFTGAGSSLLDNTGDGISGPGCPSVGLGCPAGYAQRTPLQVVTDMRAATDAQDWNAVACNYAANSFVIDDQGVLAGLPDIITSKQGLSTLFDGISPSVLQIDSYDNMVRVIDSLDAGWVVIPDRSNAYVVDCGLIVQEMVHGWIEFTGPPPPN